MKGYGDVRPALDAGEWASGIARRGDVVLFRGDLRDPSARYSRAALDLDSLVPAIGFTWTDVDQLRIFSGFGVAALGGLTPGQAKDVVWHLLSIADRIAALLRPRANG